MVPHSDLHIVHVNSETGFSGGEAQMFLLMDGLRSRGHRNTLLVRKQSAAGQRALDQGYPVATASMGNTLDLRGVWELRRHLKSLQPDLVLLHTGRASLLGGLAAWLAALPAISVRRMDRRVKRSWRTALIHRCWTRRTVAVSQAVVDCLLQGGVPATRVVMIQDAVEPEKLKARVEPSALRAAEGIAEDRSVILVLASLDRRKGIDVLLEALASLRSESAAPGPLLLIAGSGPEETALRAQTERLQLSQQVRFLGRRQDAPDLLGACDVFVLPSRREGLGVAALEAMAMGKAVIASDVGGLGQALDDGRTGLLVPAQDPQRLAAALERLLGDRELRERLGAAGPAHIAKHFLAADQVTRYEELFREVLGEVRA